MRRHQRRQKQMPMSMQTKKRADGAIPSGPGQRLRIAREAKRFSREEVAAQLRLTGQCIFDIERDDYSAGVAFIFMRGYLRSYAKLVQLPPDEIVEAFDNLGLEDSRSQPLWMGSMGGHSFAEKALRWLLIGILSGAIIVALLFWWSATKTAESTSLLAETGEPNVAQTALVEGTTKIQLQHTDLEISFTDDCWLEVYDVNHDKVYIGLKSQGDTVSLQGEPPFDVLLGNPKAVHISLNDKPVDLSVYRNKQTAKVRLG